MLNTQAYSVLSLLAGASLVSAHGYVYQWAADGKVERGASPGGSSDGVSRPTDNSDWGPANRDTGQVACGGSGSSGTTWPNLMAGSSVTATWSGNSNGNSVWPEEHHGPVIAYMANCGSTCDGVAAESLGWFKIAQDTWDGTEWPSAKITRDDNWSFTIPSDIAPGAYLIRNEIIALHYEWEKGGFQVYPYCFQADITGSGSAVPSDTVMFPGVYSPSNYTWYDYDWRAPGDGDPRDPADYVPPGPAVYTGGGASAPATGGSTGDSSSTAPSSAPSASTPADDSDSDPSFSSVGSTLPEASSGSEYPAEASATEQEQSSPTTSPEASSGSGSDNTTAQSSKTKSRWWKWRGSKSSTAAQAAETEATDEDEQEDNDEDDEYRKRAVLGRYQARQLAAL